MSAVTVTTSKGTVTVHKPQGWTFDPERWARVLEPIAIELEKVEQDKPAA